MDPTAPEVDPASPPPIPPAAAPMWVAAAKTMASVLSVLLALYVLLTISAGIAFTATRFRGDELHRIGFVSASAIDLRIGLGLVLSALLVVTAGTRPTDDQPAARPAGIVVAVTAVVCILLALLAVRAQLHQLDLSNVSATLAFQLSQATYLVGTAGPAALAAAVSGRAIGVGGRR